MMQDDLNNHSALSPWPFIRVDISPKQSTAHWTLYCQDGREHNYMYPCTLNTTARMMFASPTSLWAGIVMLKVAVPRLALNAAASTSFVFPFWCTHSWYLSFNSFSFFSINQSEITGKLPIFQSFFTWIVAWHFMIQKTSLLLAHLKTILKLN